MRFALGGVLLAFAVLGCGGDSISPNEPFPDASGSCATEGGFDGLTRQEASFLNGQFPDVAVKAWGEEQEYEAWTHFLRPSSAHGEVYPRT